MSYLKSEYTKNNISIPQFHFVLGSGISPALDLLRKKISANWEEVFSISFESVPHLKTPTAETHQGLFRYFVHKETKQSLCFQCGRLHGYEGLTPQEVIRPVGESFLAGTRNFILTNIGGGLKKEFPIGTVIAMKDHINFTGSNPLVGPNPTDPNGKPLGPRFPDMTELYNKEMRLKITKELCSQELRVEEGIYVGVLGPHLETPAEVNLFSEWGGSVVGMSTVWEAIALKHRGATVNGFSMISNLGSGLQEEGVELTSEDMLNSVKTYGEKMLRAFFNFCEKEFKQ